jgi:hypothetical protein
LIESETTGEYMTRSRFLTTLALAVALLAAIGCAGSAPAAATETPADTEPVVIEWSIGPKGGLGEGSAFITQASWEPKKLEVPANQPFIIRFVPRDDRTDTIVFGTSLEQEVGMELEDLVVEDRQPAETPVLLIKSPNRAFDVFSREHRGVGGFGSVVTAAR